MAKQSARHLWFASLLALPCAWVIGSDLPNVAIGTPPMLTQDDLRKPAAVSEWLQKNREHADKGKAREFFVAGQKAKAQKRFGPTGKAFGESAIYYPTPETISEFADVTLGMLGEIRSRNKNRKEHLKSDLISAESLYRSALSADSVIKTLSDSERRRIRLNADCVGAYLQSGSSSPTCPPLRIYGLI